MVLEMTDITSSTSISTSPYTTSYSETVDKVTNNINGPAAFWSTVGFALPIFITSGGLLVIFLIYRNTSKHASMIMISTLANLTAGSFCDLAFRSPFFAVGEDRFAVMSPELCVVFLLVPDYFMVAIIICLPLLSIERLLRLEVKEYLTTRQARQLFACLLVIAYSLAFIVTILPTTNVFADDVNERCQDYLVYGYAFAYVYSGITLVSVILTAVFSITVIFRLKSRLKNMGTTMRKKIVLKQGTISAISITGLLFLALVPFAISLQLVLMCGSYQINNELYCETIIPDYIFRMCIVLQKLCLLALPFVFLALNPTLRRKVFLTLKKNKKVENVVTMSTTTATVSRDSVCEEFGSQFDIEDDDDFITIAEDLSFGKSGDLKGEVKRRCSGSRMKQSVKDLVDVLSIISEKSESESIYTISCVEPSVDVESSSSISTDS